MPGEKRSKCVSITVLVLEGFFLIILGFTPYVDNYAHLGGFIGGIFTSCTVIKKIDYKGFFGKGSFTEEKKEGEGSRSKSKTCRTKCDAWRMRLKWIWICLPIAYIAAGIPILYTLNGDRKVCENVVCRSLSCIDIPWWDCNIRTGKEMKCDKADAWLDKNGAGMYVSYELHCPDDGIVLTGNFQEGEVTSDLDEASRFVHGKYCLEGCW